MTTYTVTGLTCNGCVARTLKVLQSFDSDARVTLDPPSATLQVRDVSMVNTALESVGNYALVDKPQARPSSLVSGSIRTSWIATYTPLLLIFCFITAVTTLEFLRSPNTNSQTWMMDFMAGFFLVFGFFKLLNLRAFALNFKAYDLAAMSIPGYAIAYPFIEIGLGVAYLMRWSPIVTNSITIAIMSVGALGVLQALQKKQTIDCACLGTVFKLPMSTVTLVEDLLMLFMAGAMLAAVF
jgi:copper chaperone CopZ